MDTRHIIALEFSGSQVKAAAAECNPTPYAPVAIPKIQAIVSEDKADCVRYGRVQNIIGAQNHASLLLQKLENLPALQGGKITGVYVALAGRSLGSMHAKAELPLPSEMTIDNDIVNKLQMEAIKAVPADKSVLKVVPRKYWVDNQPCSNPIGELGSNLKGEFTLVICSPANRNNIDRVLANNMKLNVIDYVCTPLALADMLLSEEEKQLGCALVDFGAQTTTVAVYKDRALQALATLPLGSHNITLDLVNALNTTPERAEIAKRQHADAMAEVTAAASDEVARINCYAQARNGEIIANVMNQITLAGFKPSDLGGGMVITGRGAKLGSMAKYIEAQTKMKVRAAAPGHAVIVADANIEPADYASIISIVASAAASPASKNCMEFAPQQDEQEAAAGAPFFFADEPSEPQGADEDDDDSVLEDTETIQQRLHQQQQAEKRQAEKEAARAARDAEKAEKKAARDAEKAAAKAEKAAAKEAARAAKEAAQANSVPISEKWRKKLEQLLTYNPTKDDTPLDK